MNNKKYVSLATLTSILIGVGLIATTIPAFAAATPANRPQMRNNQTRTAFQGMKPSVIGTVSAINGSTITISGKQGEGFGFGGKRGTATTSPATVSTFSIDATNATVMKNNATSSISNIIIGDTIMVQGTINGKNITATIIRDGLTNPGKMGEGRGNFASSTSPIQGNGEPIIAGAISSINGSILTITNKSKVVYTVDATNAKITQGQNTISLSNIIINDNVIVQGAVNGTSIVASSVIDQKTQANTPEKQKSNTNILYGIGSFFKHLFGF